MPRRSWIVAVAVAGGLGAASGGGAWAGAWPMAAGERQAILTLDYSTAQTAFDGQGVLLPTPPRRRLQTTLFVEDGLTSRTTLELKLGADQTRSTFDSQSGLSPAIALRQLLFQRGADVVSLSLGVARTSLGDPLAHGARTLGEARLFWGHGFVWRGRRLFSDLQLAERLADDGRQEQDVDVTLGVQAAHRLTLLVQGFAGAASGGPLVERAGDRWATCQISLLRRLGPWGVQLGGRTIVAGREIPREQGFILALWRRF